MDQPRDFPNLSSLCDEQVLDSLMDQPRDFPNLGADIATMLSWFVKWEDDMEALKERLQVGEINDLYATLSAGKVLLKRNFQQTGDANLDGVLKAMELVLQSLQKNALQLESAICSRDRDELNDALWEALRLEFPTRGALYQRADAMLEAQLQEELDEILQEHTLQLESAICSRSLQELAEALDEADRLGFPTRGALYERANAMFEAQFQEELDEIEQPSKRQKCMPPAAPMEAPPVEEQQRQATGGADGSSPGGV